MDEPDGDLPSAHDIHDLIVIRGKEYNLEPMTNLALFTAARSELWRKIAEPVLKRGGVVISARNWWSSLAYQGYGEGLSRSKIIKLTHEAMPDKYCTPDKSVILTVSDAVRLGRQGTRGKAVETFEAKVGDFQQRVNSAYPKIAKEFNVPIYIFGDKENLSKSIGKDNKAVIGIKDRNLAEAIKKILNGGDVIG